MRIIDRDGEVLKRVRAYLAPLKRQAKKWPEDAFVNFAEGFLYQLALATQYRAGVADDSVAAVRGFVPILDPAEFKEEARFRLAELLRVICSYEPAAPEHLSWTSEIARSNHSKQEWAIFESAEFHKIVAASGRIGLVRHPKVLLRQMRRLFAEVIRHPASKSLLRVGQTAADVAGAPKAIDAIGELLLAATAAPGNGDYWPPFISLGPAQVAVYQAALKMSNQNASPPPGVVMVLRGVRAGSESMSWLNVGEEDKLEREAAEGLAARQRELREAREAMNHFI